MKYYLISDNTDTKVGMRLAGVDGVVVSDAAEVERELKKAVDDESIGIVLLTEKLALLCPALILDMKLKYRRPLVITIPDRHGSGRADDSIAQYVRDAIGVKI